MATHQESPRAFSDPAHVTLLVVSAVVLVSAFTLTTPVSSDDFHGYPCTEDCSGHEAGYDWAQDNDIHDESDCSGSSQSFIEGCEAYTQENPSEDDDAQSDDPEYQPDNDPNP